jgi:HAD superfamily hydrolase (TIGR01509 family)
MIEAVVFDLDGVIVDSEPVWEQVRRQVVAEYGGTWTPEAQRRVMGMSTGEWARYLSTDVGVGLPPERVAAVVVDRMRDRYAQHVPLLPGAVAAVRRAATHWPLGLASSSPPALIQTVLEHADLRAYFAATLSTEQVERGKPAPDVYLAVADLLGHPADRCAAVEDSTNGVRSAVAAGCHVVAVPRPEYPVDPAVLSTAELTLTSLDDLDVQIIAEL